MNLIARLIVAIVAAPVLAVVFAFAALYGFVALMVDFVLGNVPKQADKAN